MKKEKGLDGKLDDVWSYLVQLIYHKNSAYCGKDTHLNSHHIYSRSKRSVRWDTQNGICLCAGCHTLSSSFSAHKTPFEFRDWFLEYEGEDNYNTLRLKANTHKHWTKHEKEELLKELQEKVLQLEKNN